MDKRHHLAPTKSCFPGYQSMPNSTPACVTIDGRYFASDSRIELSKNCSGLAVLAAGLVLTMVRMFCMALGSMVGTFWPDHTGKMYW